MKRQRKARFWKSKTIERKRVVAVRWEMGETNIKASTSVKAENQEHCGFGF